MNTSSHGHYISFKTECLIHISKLLLLLMMETAAKWIMFGLMIHFLCGIRGGMLLFFLLSFKNFFDLIVALFPWIGTQFVPNFATLLFPLPYYSMRKHLRLVKELIAAASNSSIMNIAIILVLVLRMGIRSRE